MRTGKGPHRDRKRSIQPWAGRADDRTDLPDGARRRRPVRGCGRTLSPRRRSHHAHLRPAGSSDRRSLAGPDGHLFTFYVVNAGSGLFLSNFVYNPVADFRLSLKICRVAGLDPRFRPAPRSNTVHSFIGDL
ncbi:protein of unknown function [Methylococcus capsulatus]|uniref:Uncharacterized protein n=1 Tax=Methylococcus capsulatus TaxID=414 RepID=A0AA35UFP9_METCP|nr:protein of unknown function [Methylococcus capsulatus]